MQNRLRPIIFLVLFSILMLYQNEYILHTNHFQSALKGLQNSSPTINKAYSQSYGFFNGISNSNWELYRQRYQTQHRFVDNDVRNRRNHIHGTGTTGTESDELKNRQQQEHAHLFYRDNYDSEFTCLNEMQLEVTHDHHSDHQTAKWLCDPDRIQSTSQERIKLGGNGCLIYLFDEGKGDPRQFWKDVYDELGKNCEIHLFAPHLDWSPERLNYLDEISSENQDSLVSHAWGIEGKSHSHLGRKDYLTLQETLVELGHVGHTIDVLSLECDGCEWSVYNDILHSDLIFTQLLVELHGAPYQVNDFFLEMKQNGYVVFHRETNMIEKGGGQNHAYSFIRLAPAFFEPTTVSNVPVVVKDAEADEADRLSTLPQGIRQMSRHQRIPRRSAE